MTFEEFWSKRIELGSDPYFVKESELARFVWNAAKEDSKPIVEAYFVEQYHGGVDFSYRALSGLKFGDRLYHFQTKGLAEIWALNNGYRLK